MRTLLSVATGLLFLTTASGCDSGPGQAKEPPVLKVTSPARSLIQDHAGQITVTGTVAPNAQGDAIDKVVVNSVPATVQPDGSFTAVIDVPEGATLIETVARDVQGTTASDTRAVAAGELRPVGSDIDRAVTAAISADSFTKISAAAGPIIKGLDLAALLAPLQPIVSVGGSLANLKLSVDNLTLGDIQISLAPVQGGLSFGAEITKLDVPAHITWGGTLVIDGGTTLRLTADKVTIAGTLDVKPAGTAGFQTKLVNPHVQITNPHLTASGIPGAILDILDIDAALQLIASKGAELAMGPLVNAALGALGGPQQIDVLGQKLDMQVAPSEIVLDPSGAVVAMNMKALLAGSASSPGFIFTANGAPAMDPTVGFQIGLADDLANEMLAELQATGTLNLSLPQDAGVFDTVQVQLTMPPMISADASDGRMRLVLGDLFATFTSHGAPVGKAAINARVDLKVTPAANGGAVALQLGTPEIHVDALDDVANTTGLDSDSLARATGAFLSVQIDTISQLLVAIPLPSLAGLRFQNLGVTGSDGYVVVSGQLQ